MSDIAEPKDIRKLCTHAFEPGRVCASPALRDESFCYYNHPTRKKVSKPNERRARRIARQSFALTAPTNAVDRQLALNEVVLRLAANEIDTRRAGLLLFALQIAGQTS